MGIPNGIGPSRPLRIAGLALLGLAIIAALVGVVVAVTRDEQPSTAAPPPVTSTPDSRPSTIPYPPTVTSSPAAAPIIPPLGPPEATEDAPVRDEQTSGGQGASRGEVRVYNNSTIRGLAARVAEDLSAAGWTVVEVGNYAQGTIPTTTAYYQDPGEHDDAEVLGAAFGMRVEPRFSGLTNAGPGLIVIVTNDYVSP